MTIPKRTQVQLNSQAKYLIIERYERIAGQNLHGFLPMRNAPYYKKAKQESITICDRYNDIELRKEIELNF